MNDINNVHKVLDETSLEIFRNKMKTFQERGIEEKSAFCKTVVFFNKDGPFLNGEIVYNQIFGGAEAGKNAEYEICSTHTNIRKNQKQRS